MCHRRIPEICQYLLVTLLKNNGREEHYQYHSHYLQRVKVTCTLQKMAQMRFVFTLLHRHKSCHSINKDHSYAGIITRDKPSANGTTINALSTNTVLVRCWDTPTDSGSWNLTKQTRDVTGIWESLLRKSRVCYETGPTSYAPLTLEFEQSAGFPLEFFPWEETITRIVLWCPCKWKCQDQYCGLGFNSCP